MVGMPMLGQAEFASAYQNLHFGLFISADSAYAETCVSRLNRRFGHLSELPPTPRI